jgi:hypothetical protein
VAAKSASSHNDAAAQAGKRHSKRQAVLQAQQAAKNSIEVLLQVRLCINSCKPSPVAALPAQHLFFFACQVGLCSPAYPASRYPRLPAESFSMLAGARVVCACMHCTGTLVR